MPWPLACVTGIVTFVLIGYFLPPENEPPVLRLLSFLVAGFVAGFGANHRGLLAATLGGAVATITIIGMGLAMGRAAIGQYYEFSVYARHFGFILVMGLALPPAGGVAGQALRKWLRRRRSEPLPRS